MREETRRRLDRAIFIERAKIGAMVVAGIAVITAVFEFEALDLQITDKRVAGAIEAIAPLVSKTNVADGITIEVKIDDGRHVRVVAQMDHQPHVGDRIEVTEHHHATARDAYLPLKSADVYASEGIVTSLPSIPRT